MQFQGFNLVGSAAVVFEPLYHAQEIAIILVLFVKRNQEGLVIFRGCF